VEQEHLLPRDSSSEVERVVKAVSGEGAVDEIREALKAAELEEASDQKDTAEDVKAPVEEDSKEEPAEEPAAEEAEPEPEPEARTEGDEPTSSRWAAIKRAEKRNLQVRNELKRERDELRKMRDELQSELEKSKSFRQSLEQDPIEALKGVGLTFEDLSNRVLNDGKASPDESIRRYAKSQEEELKKIREEQQKLQQYISTKEQQQLVNDYRAGIRKAIDGDQFELLKAYPDAEDEVFQLATLYAQEHGTVLTAEEAAGKIQDELKSRLETLASHDAVRRILEPSQDSSSEARRNNGRSKEPVVSGKKPRTLTNNLASTPPKTEPKSEELSEWDQIQEAAKLVGADAWNE